MALHGLRLSGCELDGRDARRRARTDEEPMIPDIPLDLLRVWNPAIPADPGNEWARACADAATRAIEDPDARLIREIGLLPSRKPRNLGERSLGDDRLGRDVMSELAKRQRGQR